MQYSYNFVRSISQNSLLLYDCLLTFAPTSRIINDRKSLRNHGWFRIISGMLICPSYFPCCISLSFLLLHIFIRLKSVILFQRPLPATTLIFCLLFRPDAVRCQLWSAEIHLRFPVACDHAVTNTFRYHSMLLPVTNWLLCLMRMAPEGHTPLRTSPLASELLPTCEALSFAGAALPLTCRTVPANSSPFAALTTFGFVTIVPRYLLPQVIPSHSFTALIALVVRRENGNVALLARCLNGLGKQLKPAPGIARPRQRHLVARLTYPILCVGVLPLLSCSL